MSKGDLIVNLISLIPGGAVLRGLKSGGRLASKAARMLSGIKNTKAVTKLLNAGKILIKRFNKSWLGRFVKRYGGKFGTGLDVLSSSISTVVNPAKGVFDWVLFSAGAIATAKKGSKVSRAVALIKNSKSVKNIVNAGGKVLSNIKKNKYVKKILNNKYVKKISENKIVKKIFNKKNIKIAGKAVYRFVSNPVKSIQTAVTSTNGAVKKISGWFSKKPANPKPKKFKRYIRRYTPSKKISKTRTPRKTNKISSLVSKCTNSISKFGNSIKKFLRI